MSHENCTNEVSLYLSAVEDVTDELFFCHFPFQVIFNLGLQRSGCG
jgi:hypothetical protein